MCNETLFFFFFQQLMGTKKREKEAQFKEGKHTLMHTICKLCSILVTVFALSKVVQFVLHF